MKCNELFIFNESKNDDEILFMCADLLIKNQDNGNVFKVFINSKREMNKKSHPHMRYDG